jgi:hypothetical protein
MGHWAAGGFAALVVFIGALLVNLIAVRKIPSREPVAGHARHVAFAVAPLGFAAAALLLLAAVRPSSGDTTARPTYSGPDSIELLAITPGPETVLSRDRIRQPERSVAATDPYVFAVTIRYALGSSNDAAIRFSFLAYSDAECVEVVVVPDAAPEGVIGGWGLSARNTPSVEVQDEISPLTHAGYVVDQVHSIGVSLVLTDYYDPRHILAPASTPSVPAQRTLEACYRVE